jgi:hypothetical protein
MTNLVNQPTLEPTRKVAAGALGGAAATIVVVVVQMAFNVVFPVGFEAAVAVVFGFLAAYVTKEKAV